MKYTVRTPTPPPRTNSPTKKKSVTKVDGEIEECPSDPIRISPGHFDVERMPNREIQMHGESNVNYRPSWLQ